MSMTEDIAATKAFADYAANLVQRIDRLDTLVGRLTDAYGCGNPETELLGYDDLSSAVYNLENARASEISDRISSVSRAAEDVSASWDSDTQRRFDMVGEIVTDLREFVDELNNTMSELVVVSPL